MDEFDTIARLFAPLAKGEAGALGLTDDAAVLMPSRGCEMVLTKDAIVEGVHFFPDDPPEAIAAKLLRVNLSDLAAKGAKPRAFLLAAAFPPQADDEWLIRFTASIADEQALFGGTLIGGDTVSTPGPSFYSLTAIGEVPQGTMTLRRGARPGDLVCVSGTIGDAALYIANRVHGRPVMGAGHLEVRYRYPQPRLSLGRVLRGMAGACCDISDGLVADLGHLCEQSGVGAVIEAGKVPLSRAAADSLAMDPGLMDTILTGGDDYELVFSLPSDRAVAALSTITPVTVIGRFEAGQGVQVMDAAGLPMALGKTGWRHAVGGTGR